MNPARLGIQLRPRKLLETCDLAVAFVRAHRRAYFRLWWPLLGVPPLLLWLVTTWLETPAWLAWLATLGWAGLAQGPFTLLGARLLFDSEARRGQVMASFARQLGSYVALLSTTHVSMLLQASTLVLAPRAFARGVLAPEVALLEGLRGRVALRRTARLGQSLSSVLVHLGWWGPVAFVMGAVLADATGIALTEFLLQSPLPLGSLWQDGWSLYSLMGFCVVVPFVATARLLAYVGGRAEQDAWDVKLRFLDIAAEGAR